MSFPSAFLIVGRVLAAMAALLALGSAWAQAPSTSGDMKIGDVDVPAGTVTRRSVDTAPGLKERLQNATNMGPDKKAGRGLSTVSEAQASVLTMITAAAKRELPAPLRSGFTLVDLSALEHRGYAFKGYFLESPPGAAGVSRITRTYAAADGTLLGLSEWAFAADGGGIVAYNEGNTARVGRYPASLSGARAASGTTLWTMTWATESKLFTMYVQFKDHVLAHQDTVAELAQLVASD